MTLVRHVSLNLRGSDSRLRQSCSVAVVIWFNIYIYVLYLWEHAWAGGGIINPSMPDVCMYVCMYVCM